MSTAVDQTLKELDSCGCCAGVAVRTPVEVGNRPGLSAIVYRVGTHAAFKQTLLARLADPARTALRPFAARDDGDFSIALLDAWAAVADVLTFYQERIANESYLRTATERLSVLELARLIGYELRPGVAASAYLAFTLEKVPGATEQQARSLGVPSRTMLDAGIKVQSVPGPDEQPQVFETIERIEARIAWNSIRPRLTIRHPVKWDTDTLYFDGLSTGLKKGDGLLVTPYGQDAIFRLVADVKNDNERQVTVVRLAPLPGGATSAYGFISDGYEKGKTVAPFAEPYLGKTIDADDLQAAAQKENFEVQKLFDNLAAAREPAPRLIAFRTRAAIFGHNAQRWESLPVSQRYGEYALIETNQGPKQIFRFGAYAGRDTSWIDERLSDYHGVGANDKFIFLDNVYQSVVRGSWIVLKQHAEAKAYLVTEVAEVTQADFALSAKVSRLTLDTRSYWSDFSPRKITVFAQSEELSLARHPNPDATVAGSVIELDTWVDGLFAGHNIVVGGELHDKRGVTASEVAHVAKVEHVLTTEGSTRLTLTAPLAHTYVRATVEINANVALATHGETVREVLGGGDSTRPFQSFTLKQPPLTYVAASTPSGTETTLSVRVGGVLWREVASFYGHGPEERIYVTRTDDDGKTTVRFGDGLTGARLPTGQDNVTATYRKGSGLAGRVKADQLSQLMTRPLGLKGATNPLPAEGGDAAEVLKDARRSAPLTVLTLDRIVSLQDYEDFARAFAGIGKALATWTWDGERRGVFVTVAAADGSTIANDSLLAKNLLAAMRAAGDPDVPFTLASYIPRLFRLKAKVKIDDAYVAEKVLAEIERHLRAHFSFDARSFGQPVTLGEVLAVMQRVRGTVAVDVDELYRVQSPLPLIGLRLPGTLFPLLKVRAQSKLQARLGAAVPRMGAGAATAAELLTLDPSPLKLEVTE